MRRVADGGTAFDPEVVSQLIGRRRRESPLKTLSPRELKVLEVMAEGLSNAAIGKRLWLTVSAVEKHAGSIFAKLGLRADQDGNPRVLAVLAYLDGRD